jgi:hypothetical protein
MRFSLHLRATVVLEYCRSDAQGGIEWLQMK